MSSRFRFPACLVLLSGLVALGLAPAGAAGVGLHLRGYAQNIPRTVAGTHNLHPGAGAPSPSRHVPNTRGIQLDGAGKSAATRSFK
jgi:hypothetical protein